MIRVTSSVAGAGADSRRFAPTVATVLLAILSISLLSTPRAHAIPPAWQVSKSVGKAVMKYFGKESAEEATEYLAKKGGREMVERVTSAAAKEGGEEAVEQVAKLAAKYGPEVISALDNAPSVAPIVKALSELTETEAKSAIARLAAGAAGRELAETVIQRGSSALVSELAHPGIGGILVRALGQEGAELATKLTNRQAIAIGRHADDLAKLPQTQKSGLLALLRQDTEKMAGFMGRFVEANPGKTLFTVATTTVILAEPDRILGGDEIVFDADGNPVLISKAGIAGRTIKATGDAAAHVSDSYIRPLFLTLLAFASAFFILWMTLKLWHVHAREKLKTASLQAASLQSDSAATIEGKATTRSTSESP